MHRPAQDAGSHTRHTRTRPGGRKSDGRHLCRMQQQGDEGVDQVFELAVNTVIEAEENSYEDTRVAASGGGTSSGGGGGAKVVGKIKKRTCRIL